MDDLAETIVSKMNPVEPIGYIVQICGNDYRAALLEAKGVVFKGDIAYLVRSAPCAEDGEPVAPKETWESKLCPSADAFRFLVGREYERLSYCFEAAYVTGPDGSRQSIEFNRYGGWNDSDGVNKRVFDRMLAAMSILKVPSNGLFVW